MIIEFLGPPRSGKSHQIKLLKQHYESLGKSVYVIEDRVVEKDILVKVEDVLDYNVLFFNKVFEKLLYAKLILKSDIIILDRGFYDAFAWFHTEFLNKSLSSKQVEAAMNFYELFHGLIDKAIFIDADIPISISRHKETGVSGTTDDYIINELYLCYMKHSYRLLTDKYRSDKMLMIDGNQTIDVVYEKLSSFLDLKNINIEES